MQALAPVDGVVGNMDRPELRALLPDRRVVQIAGVQIGMLHDPGPRGGRAERLVGSFPDCHAVVYGHTHEPELSRVGDVWILNPGSPTERRRSPTHSMIVLEVGGGELRPRLLTV